MAREKTLITFVCEFCGQEVTELAGPGQTPHYCAAHMAEAKAHMSKMRMRALRKRQKAATAARVASGRTDGQER